MKKLFLLFLIAWCLSITGNAQKAVNVTTPGTLASLILSQEADFTVTGTINGTDAKYLREQVSAGRITSLNLADVRIVAGGSAYYENYTTKDDVVPERWMQNCPSLTHVVLPSSAKEVGAWAFSSTNLKGKLVIPDGVSKLGDDAFSYNSKLDTVVLGSHTATLSRGAFYSTGVKHVMARRMVPPSTSDYLFSSNPTVHVYTAVVDDYKDTGWKSYGTIVGGLEDFYPLGDDPTVAVNGLREQFFEDAACTTLKAEYQAMSDEELTEALTTAGMPEFMAGIALKLKNDSWADYEKDFRIHSYCAYSDAKYWNNKLSIRSASFMGNPTGVYAKASGDQIYVFVDDDVSEGATLYIVGMAVDKMVGSAKAGQRLKKGLNVVDGDAGCYYYILYTADTKAMTKRVSEWPDIKIHIEGGVADGYFDAARHTDADYKKLLKAATYSTFVVKGKHSVMNLRTSIFKSHYPNAILKSSATLDSISVWEKEFFGICEDVANGLKAGAPWYLSGGDAFYPGFFNNPTYVDNDSPTAYAHANEFGIHLSKDASQICVNPYVSSYDEGGTAHEFGHQLQDVINLEGTTEGSNDLFANVVRYLMGHRASTGRPLSRTMYEFGHKVPFYWRGPDYGFLRMFYTLYLYYHLARNNTAFYPELFKALRSDKLSTYGSNTNSSGLKFVRKVCDVAQEDLTDFFTAFGFFEPATRRYLECYGDHYVTNRQADINTTKTLISRYPVKNREILFVEDRVDYVPSNGLIIGAGQHRSYRDGEKVGQCGDVGQFTDFTPETTVAPGDYTYMQSDTIYALHGEGGLGFLLLDADDQLVFASNAKHFFMPAGVSTDFTMYSVGSDGALREIPKAGYGTQFVDQTTAGYLADSLTDNVIKAVVSGKINSNDVKELRRLVQECDLMSVDLQDAKMVIGGTAYYNGHKLASNTVGDYMFYNCYNLLSVCLPESATKIGSNAFAGSGLLQVTIPDNISSVGGDAFAYCINLKRAVIGSGVKSMQQGVFYSCDELQDVYVKATTPPTLGAWMFSTKKQRVIHVYKSALEAYKSSDWANADYGILVGDLEDYEDIISGIEEIAVNENGQDSMVNGQRSTVNGQVYDLSGKPVTTPEKGGIYIINGKIIKK
ncbi:MAG: leucine-rich repeat protein [Bacteroidaceae bacterium]|nr:leucine-rich repeat protein [Bacteroidaceae bacterium]